MKAPEDEFSALDLPEDALDLPEDEDAAQPEEKKSLFGGMTALMKGVARRVPEEDEAPEEDAHADYRPPKAARSPRRRTRPTRMRTRTKTTGRAQIDNPSGMR